MNNFSFLRHWFFALAFLLAMQLMSISSCTNESAIEDGKRLAIDTLSRNQINILRPELDSLCALKKDSVVTSLKDSIYISRKKAIQEKLRKLNAPLNSGN